MRIAVLSDVHGNLPALEAVLAEVEADGFDIVVSGGDVVAGPMPRACLELLAGLDDSAGAGAAHAGGEGHIRWVMGNADREVVAAWDGGAGDAEVVAARGGGAGDAEVVAARGGGAGDAGVVAARDGGAGEAGDPAWRAAAFAAARLERAHRDLLASFAPTVALDHALACHGTPRSDVEIVTPRTSPERLAEVLAGVRAPVVVAGHVHLQFIQRSGPTQWVNAGSVGMPYEGRPGAFWLELGEQGPHHRRTTYDLDAAEAAIRATGYPDAGDVVDAIRGRVTREEAMDAFGG